MSTRTIDGAATKADGPNAEDVGVAADAACARIAPLWPLRAFVAVNPFLGFVGQPFEEVCATFPRIAGVDMLPAGPAGEVAPRPCSQPGAVATVADVLDGLADGDRQASLTAFMIDEISRWCASWFDEGQAVWRAPSRARGFYAGWKAAMIYDRNAEVMGVRNFRAAVAAASDDPRSAIVEVVTELGIPSRAVEDYLFRALFDVRGWAAMAGQRAWSAKLEGGRDDTLVELLAVRVVWGHALFQAQRTPAFHVAWRSAMQRAASAPDGRGTAVDPAVSKGLARLHALETAYQDRLFCGLAQRAATPIPSRPPLQAAFCIDVRSEPYRRALEMACQGAETLGFAGFFGFPIEYVPLGQARGGAQCPVLLKPNFVVREGVKGASEREEQSLIGLRRLRRRLFKAWKAFKLSAVSSFGFVETAGLLSAPKLVGDALSLTRPVAHPRSDGIDAEVVKRLGPHLGAEMRDGRATGFAPAERVDMAERVLRAMSLTSGLARIVLLAGHGSTTVNNPHAAGLDCGACGGHTGEANARVAAAVLNDSAVREGLRARGLQVPADTWFVPALHDTTLDDVTLFDLDDVPASHTGDLLSLKAWLEAAGRQARLQRARRLGLDAGEDIDAAIRLRSRDWSQVRPEWGLAGCAAFVAAPRALTRDLDLEGRVFLHTYDAEADADGSVLELIMTAPMVVASWINLQYYGSAVNNTAFGAGDKTLHNVVGTLGVLEGNGGDLKAGLPWQSVHDGQRLVHEPLRLTVVIAAKVEAIDRVIARHAGVRDLVDNGWLHLFAITGQAGLLRRVQGEARWERRAG